jgi:DNA-binding SARP family transcriptional activator
MRLQALEMRLDADLHLGRHTDVISELQRLAPAYPMRERLHAMLMLAFYRDGRQGEALAVYRHAREVLAEELGAEPGIELRELNQRILAGDPALAFADSSLEAAGAARAAMRQRRQRSSRPGNGYSPARRFNPRRPLGCPPGRVNRHRQHPR